MNPYTHQFEPLDSPAAVERAHTENWKIFKMGETITIKDTKFTVKDISPNKLVLRPHGSGLENLESLAAKIEDLSEPKPFVQGIGWAVKQMQNGAKLARAGWNGKGMFLYYVPADSYPARTAVAKEQWGENALVPYGAYVAMKTAQGNVVPWLASQTDLLATDWEIV